MDQQNKTNIEIIKMHIDSLRSFLITKSEAVLILSSLSLGFLVIATFNEALLTITDNLKIIICFLLILSPLSLIFFLIEITWAINNVKKEIEKITKNNIDVFKGKNVISKLLHIILFCFPYFGALSLLIIMIYAATIIWP